MKRSAVIALFKGKKSTKEIVLELGHLHINRIFVYRTIKRYLETGSIKKTFGGGRRPTATAQSMVKKVRERIRRNPKQSANFLAKSLCVSDRSVRRILKDKIGAKPYKMQQVQTLSDSQKKERVKRSKALKRRHANGDLENIVFSDEKIFTVQQVINKQNDRVWLTKKSPANIKKLFATRDQKPASVMVWAGITRNGRTPMVFVPQGVKIDQKSYRRLVLNAVLKPWAHKFFKSEKWVFQQDSAPAHKALKTQEWLRKNVPDFISTSEWPAKSPDLNPMDYSVWGILQPKVCSKKHRSLESLKQSLLSE